MFYRKCVLHSLVFLISLVSFSLLPISAAAQEEAILKLILNGEDMGEFFMVLAADGDVWMLREDLDGTRLRGGLGKDVEFVGKTYVSLRSIEGLDFTINERDIALEVQAEPGLFRTQTMDFAFERPYEVVYSKENSAFLNYGLFYSSDEPSLNLSAELGLRLGDYLGISTFNYLNDDDENRAVRLMTFVRRDYRDDLRTVTFGDFATTSGVLGSRVTVGGISLMKNYSVDPYFMSFPSLSFEGTLETMSEVSLYVNDVRVRQERLMPGEFEFQNVPPIFGLGTADIVIKDIYGRERTVSSTFFASEGMLRKGLHEYSYGIGFLRDEFGVESFSYSKPVFLSFHNFGFTDSLKAGYALEASDELINVGPAAAFILSRAGTVDAALSVSHSEGDTGAGGFLRYFFRSRLASVFLSLRSLSRDFSSLSLRPSDDKPSLEINTGLGINTSAGSVTATFASSDRHVGQDISIYALGYSKPVTRKTTVFARASRTETGDEEEDEIFLGVQAYFGKDISGTFSYSGNEDDALMASVQKSLPLGPGFGFRAATESRREHTDFRGNLDYQGDYGVYGVGYQNVKEGDNFTLSASGGAGYIDGSAFLSRPITDSFAKVKVGGLEGVRTYYSGNEVGRTDENGDVIIPNILSFHDNKISIEHRDIPVNYNIESLTKYVSPQYRGGALVRFDVDRTQGIVGRLYAMVDGKKVPVDLAAMTVSVGDAGVDVLVGRGGEFYLENVPPGKHPAVARRDGKSCDFDIIIPESQDIWITLDDVICEMHE